MAGCAIPVFALRSAGSFGVGDFGDLKMMIDWVAHTGQRILQILPINDTTNTGTWVDSYPYSAISIYALHPMYADLRQLPALKDGKAAGKFRETQAALNALDKIDYEAVNKAKRQYLFLIYQQTFAEVRESKAYAQFLHDTQEWLSGYADYSVRRDKRIGSVAYGHDFYRYVQFVLDMQMREAHSYAQSRGVMLKGDIPIGVNRHGCDVEMDPRYFNMNGQAGAPPDAFSVNPPTISPPTGRTGDSPPTTGMPCWRTDAGGG